MQTAAGGASEVLRPAGLALAAATLAAHMALTLVAMVRSCRRYGDLLHGLCLHAALVGCLQGGLVTVLHALLQSAERHDQPVWRICCKVYLFCRIFLPGLFLYLTAALTVCFRSIRYPPRRCGQSCTRLGYLTAHCLPWAACTAGLLPVLLMHKEGTEAALRSEGRCMLIERWAWLGPLSVLMGAPLLADLMLTCLLCAYKPYRVSGGGGDSCRSSFSSAEDGNDYHDDDHFGDDSGDSDEDAWNSRDHRSDRRRQRRRRRRGRRRLRDGAVRQGNGLTAHSSSLARGRTSGGYYVESRLLRGPPMRRARSLLLLLSVLQACTQLPHCATAMLQTVLRNMHSRQLIQQSTVDALYWLHLAYFPVAGLLLMVFTLQLHRAFRITEVEMEKEIAGCRRQVADRREVLQTTSMLTSV